MVAPIPRRAEGVARGARLRFFGVPILGTPYFSFPLENRRKSGLLTPYYAQTTTRGFEFGLPWYWNIAPERDLVLTPVYMAKRGVQLKNHFRYLDRRYAGEHRVLSGRWGAGLAATRAREPLKGRILHVVGFSLPEILSGYTVRTRHTVGAQRELGLDPHVVTQLGFPWNVGVADAPDWRRLDGVLHHRLRQRQGDGSSKSLDEHLALNARRLVELARDLRPAVLHAASDYRNAMLALEVGRCLHIPVIYEVRGLWEETWLSKRGEMSFDSSWYRLRQARELDAMHQADHVVALAHTMRAELINRGVAPDKITVVPNAVDPNAFSAPSPNMDLARQLGFAHEDVVVGYISSFVPYEGIHYLIEATAKVRASGRRVKCLLVGDGESRRDLERCAEQFGIADEVVFTGRVPHELVHEYYGVIDVFVVPRTNDRVSHLVSPLTPFEAMAAGRALVVSGTRALRELVRAEDTGLVFEPENATDLARQIDRLVDDRVLRTRLGHTAREWVLEHHTWRANAERYLGRFTWSADGRALWLQALTRDQRRLHRELGTADREQLRDSRQRCNHRQRRRDRAVQHGDTFRWIVDLGRTRRADRASDARRRAERLRSRAAHGVLQPQVCRLGRYRCILRRPRRPRRAGPSASRLHRTRLRTRTRRRNRTRRPRYRVSLKGLSLPYPYIYADGRRNIPLCPGCRHSVEHACAR